MARNDRKWSLRVFLVMSTLVLCACASQPKGVDTPVELEVDPVGCTVSPDGGYVRIAVPRHEMRQIRWVRCNL